MMYFRSSFNYVEAKARVYDRATILYSELLGGAQIRIGKAYLSPLRDESHPSFTIFFNKDKSAIMWKDHGTGDSGDIIKLHALLWGTKYVDALKRLDGRSEGEPSRPYRWAHTKVSRVIFTKKSETGTADLIASYDDWREDTLAYWKKHGVCRNTLTKFNVRPCKSASVGSRTYVVANFPDKPVYAYHVYRSLKIYAPMHGQQCKWRSSCSAYDVQGLEQLPKDPIPRLIITKSLKDVMVLHEMGEYAIAPSSENTMLPKEVNDSMLRKMGTNDIFLFFDNDEAGKKCAAKMLMDNIYLHNIVLPDGGPKDISDLVLEVGFNEAQKCLKSILPQLQ